MARIAASKSPVYGSCCEQSAVCHVCNMTSRFSGSARALTTNTRSCLAPGLPTFGACPSLPEANEKRFEVLESEMRFVELFPVEGLTEAPFPPVQTLLHMGVRQGTHQPAYTLPKAFRPTVLPFSFQVPRRSSPLEATPPPSTPLAARSALLVPSRKT